MKTFDEVVEWLRDNHILNKMYKNVGHHYDYTVYTTMKREVNSLGKSFIMNSFYWGYDDTEDWAEICKAYVSWFNS